MNDHGPLQQSALDANRAGRLTHEQRLGFRGQSRGFRKAELQFAVIVTIIGLLVWFGEGPAKYATVKPLIGVGCIILAGFLVVRSVIGGDALTQDLRGGQVVAVEGAISKSLLQSRSTATYYFHVAGTRVKVPGGVYRAAPDAGMVKLYYLPHSHELVNMERLPDAGLPAGALKSPQLIGEILAQAFHAHDPIQAAEARAHLATMADAVKAGTTEAQMPGAGARDPRPLAAAIVGAWTNAFMSITFAADGTLTATIPGMATGQVRTGQWSIDPSGRLVSDVMGGRPLPTEAWVSGDELTVNMGKTGLKLQRVST